MSSCLLFVRGAGPIGYPGGAEVVNMRPPAYLLERGIRTLPCIGDGRQSGTSGSPSILNASPEAAAGGGLALLRTGDRVRIDLGKGEANILIDGKTLEARRPRYRPKAATSFPPTRRRGRRSSDRWSTSSTRGWCSSRRSSIATSRTARCRATIIEWWPKACAATSLPFHQRGRPRIAGDGPDHQARCSQARAVPGEPARRVMTSQAMFRRSPFGCAGLRDARRG